MKQVHLRFEIDPSTTTTGHNLIAHIITFQLSHWESSYAIYSHYSSCIGAHTCVMLRFIRATKLAK